MPSQTFGNPFIQGESVDDLRRSTQFWMERIFNHLDQIAGLRGTPTFYADIDANTKRITGLGKPVRSTDAERVDFSLRRVKEGGNFDAGGMNIENVHAATDMAQAVNLEQLRNEILATLASGLAAEPYVVATLSATLTAERVLTPELSVLTVTDNGAGSTIVVGIATNGVSDAKLRQGVATSVVGRSANSLGNVADIAAASDGQILGRFGTTVSFSATPNIATSVTVPLVIGGIAVGSSLDLKSTSGAGTTDFIRFLVGNNGATEAARILDNGNFGFGTISPGNRVEIGGTGASRLAITGGTATAAIDWALTSGWGANAIISAVSGNDVRGTVTVTTSVLDTPTLNPVITLTFKDGTWTNAPFAVSNINANGTGPMGASSCKTTATTLVLTYDGTPTALSALTYIFNYWVVA